VNFKKICVFIRKIQIWPPKIIFSANPAFFSCCPHDFLSFKAVFSTTKLLEKFFVGVRKWGIFKKMAFLSEGGYFWAKKRVFSQKNSLIFNFLAQLGTVKNIRTKIGRKKWTQKCRKKKRKRESPKLVYRFFLTFLNFFKVNPGKFGVVRSGII